MLSARRLLYASGQAGRHSGQDRRTRPRGEVSLLSSEVHAARAPRDISFSFSEFLCLRSVGARWAVVATTPGRLIACSAWLGARSMAQPEASLPLEAHPMQGTWRDPVAPDLSRVGQDGRTIADRVECVCLFAFCWPPNRTCSLWPRSCLLHSMACLPLESTSRICTAFMSGVHTWRSLLKSVAAQQFAAGKLPMAVKMYTDAIKLAPSHTLYGNRSACWCKGGNYQQAFEDACKAIDLMPTFAKGYARKGAALHGLDRWGEAIKVYEAGLKLEPSNEDLKQGVAHAMKRRALAGGDWELVCHNRETEGERGDMEAYLKHPVAIAPGPNGGVVVLDHGREMVRVMNRDCTYTKCTVNEKQVINRASLFGQACGVACDGDHVRVRTDGRRRRNASSQCQRSASSRAESPPCAKATSSACPLACFLPLCCVAPAHMSHAHRLKGCCTQQARGWGSSADLPHARPGALPDRS